MTPAGRNRATSAAAVAVYLLAARAAAPGEAERAALHYAVVATLGYGHLVGALRLVPAQHGARALGAACRLLAVANALVLGGLALERWPALVLVLLGVSLWHVVENDLALADAYHRGHRPGPLPRGLDAQLACAGATLLGVGLARASLSPAQLGPLLEASALAAAGPGLLGAAAAAAGAALLVRGRRRAFGAALSAAGAALAFGRPPALEFAELFAASTLHHLVSWGVLLADRRRTAPPAEARSLGRRLLLAHGVPAALLLALQLAPGAAAASLGALLLSPPLYLLLSSLHVAQTAIAREAAARRCAAPRRRAAAPR
jgi:hypothetical protein